MTRVLITGMSGAGKSTLLQALRDRGYLTVDTDYDGWQGRDATWDEARMSALLAEHRTIVVSGTAENQGSFYDRFEHVVYLYAPLDTLLLRLQRRTNNPYGRTTEQQEDVRRYVREVEPLLRRGVTVELDAHQPVADLADAVEGLLLTPPQDTSSRAPD